MSRILVVEDSASMRQMIVFTLEEGGFEVIEAADGQEGLETAQSQAFDAVISDVKMPRKDGLELTAALRALPDYKFVPILLLTTEFAAEKKDKGRAAGATGWIVKPFNPETLIYSINKVLR